MSQVQRPHQYNPELISEENNRLQNEGKVVDMSSELGLSEGDLTSPTATLPQGNSNVGNTNSTNVVSMSDYTAANEARLRAELQCRKAEERAEQLVSAYKTTQSIIAYRSRSQLEALKAEVTSLKNIISEDRGIITSLQTKLGGYEGNQPNSACHVNFGSLQDLSIVISDLKSKVAELEHANNSAKFEMMEYRTVAEQAQEKILQGDSIMNNKDIDELVRLQAALDLLLIEKQTKHNEHVEEYTPMAITLMSEVKMLRKQKEETDSLINNLRIQLASGNTMNVEAEGTEDEDKAKLLIKLNKSEATVQMLTQELTNLAQTFTKSKGEDGKFMTDIQNLQRAGLQKDAIIKKNEELIAQRDEALREIKENAKNVLRDASEQIKKMKDDNSSLREEVLKTKQGHQADVKKMQAQLVQARSASAAQRRVLLTKMQSELQAIKQDHAAVRACVTSSSASGMSNIAATIVDEFQRRMGVQTQLVATLRENYERELKLRKKIFNQYQELKGNIRVYARVRPLSSQEKSRGEQGNVVSLTRDGELKVENAEKKQTHKFEFEKVFNDQSTQDEVFHEVQDLVTSVLDGFNVCMFAYGQTGSGKTFTMEGYPGNAGVNTRALDKLFSEISSKTEWNYNVRLTLLEIYNEKVQDLLSENQDANLKVVQGKEGMEVLGLTHMQVESAEDVQRLLVKGKKNRHVTKTDMNEHSSRSHLILSVYTTGTNKFTGATASGKMHLIDLAGSERISRSGVTGEALKEAQKINYSLSALGNVISARANKKEHVPYRDSMLTFLLQDSLERNSKTLMFVQLSPTTESVMETLCSLRFAERVRKVELGKAEKKTGVNKDVQPEDDE